MIDDDTEADSAWQGIETWRHAIRPKRNTVMFLISMSQKFRANFDSNYHLHYPEVFT